MLTGEKVCRLVAANCWAAYTSCRDEPHATMARHSVRQARRCALEGAAERRVEHGAVPQELRTHVHMTMGDHHPLPTGAPLTAAGSSCHARRKIPILRGSCAARRRLLFCVASKASYTSSEVSISATGRAGIIVMDTSNASTGPLELGRIPAPLAPTIRGWVQDSPQDCD